MPGPPESFAQLIARCAADPGDHGAWKLLYDQNKAYLYRWATEYLTRGGLRRDDQIEPEDVCMDIWHRLLRDDRRALKRFDARSLPAFRAYLKSAALNHVIDLKRRSQAKGRDQVQPMDPEQLALIARDRSSRGPSREVSRRDLEEKAKQHLRARWLHSPSAQRDLLIYCFHFEDGISAARIAELPNIKLTRGGVEKVIKKIYETLRELSDGDGMEAQGS